MKKLRSKKGFTLMEMLIVVAIIGVLVAIAVPAFNSSLTKAQQATDQANIRSAVAVATVAYLSDGTETDANFSTDGTFSGTAYTMKAIGNYNGTSFSPGSKLHVKVTDGAVAVTFPTT